MKTTKVGRAESSRFYTASGEPVYEIPKKRGGGMKKPTITEARENGWLASVTTVLNAMAKPGLQNWLIEQPIVALENNPPRPGESINEWINRIVRVERLHEKISEEASDLGTEIHEAISNALKGIRTPELAQFVDPVIDIVNMIGRVVWTEKVLVGDGYAGRADILIDNDRFIVLGDFKTTGKVPEKEAYKEHLMQTAAYAKTLGNTADRSVMTCLIYISTQEPGKVVVHKQEDWSRNYEAFQHLLQVWKYVNDVP